MSTLAVNEVYDRLVAQGEGPSLGRLCTFVRLARCNLDCGEGPGATWKCDTPYTWRWRARYPRGTSYDPAVEVTTTEVEEVVERVLALCPPMVVISGGEPLLQRRGLTDLVAALAGAGVDVEIETNGTRAPWAALAPAVFNISPKLANSGVGRDRAWDLDALRGFIATGRARFKFVASDVRALEEIAELCKLAGIPDRLVWVMPAGTTAVAIRQALGRVAEEAIARRWNITTRLHVTLWGTQRGR